MIKFLKTNGQGEDRGKKYKPYREGMARQLNQAHVAEEHGQIVTSIVKPEEQLAGFTQLLEVVARSTGQLEGFTGGPSQAQEVW